MQIKRLLLFELNRIKKFGRVYIKINFFNKIHKIL